MKKNYWYLLCILIFRFTLLDATSLIFRNKTKKTIWIRRVFPGGTFKRHKKGPGEATELGHGECVVYKPEGMLDSTLSTRGWQYSIDGNKWSSAKLLTPIEVPGKLYGKSLVAVPSGQTREIILTGSPIQILEGEPKKEDEFFSKWLSRIKKITFTFPGRALSYASWLAGRVVDTTIGTKEYGKEKAKVRMGAVAPKEEKDAVVKREEVVRGNQEKFLSMKFSKDEKPLSIAFIASGGGVRARIATTGFVQGASEIGLFDCVTYFSALSGSTWMLAPWIMRRDDIDIKRFREIVIKDCKKDDPSKIINNIRETKNLVYMYFYYNAWKRPFGVANIFGAMLPDIFLKDVIKKDKDSQWCFLGDFTKNERSKEGKSVIPIFEARVFIKSAHDICCFTPWEAGGRFFCGNKGAYIPIWSFGRRFNKGSSVKPGLEPLPGINIIKSNAYGPRPTLGFLMSIWGSGFTTTPGKFLGQDIPVNVTSRTWKGTPLATCQVNNFMKGLSNCREYSNQEKLDLFDSGLVVNLPVLATYRRPEDKKHGIKEGSPPDVMIIFDTSKSSCEDIAKTREEIDLKEKQGLWFPFPKIPNFKEIGKKGEEFAKNGGLLVFDENPNPKKYKDWEIPTVIYMPLSTFFDKKDLSKIYKTDKFDYSEKDANKLMNATEKYIKDREALIKKVFEKRRELNILRHRVKVLGKYVDDLFRVRLSKINYDTFLNYLKEYVREISEKDPDGLRKILVGFVSDKIKSKNDKNLIWKKVRSIILDMLNIKYEQEGKE